MEKRSVSIGALRRYRIGVKLIFLLMACGEPPELPTPTEADAAMMDSDLAEPDAGTADAGVSVPTFADLERDVIVPRCARCHDRPNDSTTRASLTYERLIGMSVRLPSMRLVEPGDPDRSFLYRKLTNSQAAACEEDGLPAFGCGGPMPPAMGGGLLAGDAVSAIRLWIEAGATER
jgi:hypothetical protein